MKKVLPFLCLVFLSSGATYAWEIKGAISSVWHLEKIVVRNQQEWEKLWENALGNKVDPLQTVDFDEEMVVGVFLGKRPTSGYGVELEVLPDPWDNSRVVILYREILPSPGRIYLTMETHPFVLRKIKIYPLVIFEYDLSYHSADFSP